MMDDIEKYIIYFNDNDNQKIDLFRAVHSLSFHALKNRNRMWLCAARSS